MRLIDSSIIVKFFAEEPGWESLRESMYSSVTIDLALVELGSGLMKKVKNGEFNGNAVPTLLSKYSSIVQLLDQKKYLSEAYEIAMSNNFPIYDSLFIAAAKNENYELATCDGKQAKVGRKEGIRVIEF